MSASLNATPDTAAMTPVPTNDAVLSGPGFRPTQHGVTARDFTLDDPYDLAPVEGILATAIEKEVERCEDGQPLVILMGENHSMPSHRMAKICALSHLAARRNREPDSQSRNFLLTCEVPYNILFYGANEVSDLSFSDALRHRLHESDPDNDIFIRLHATFPIIQTAPQAKNRLWQTARQLKIPVIFNDTAKKYDFLWSTTLDLADPALSAAAQRLQDDFELAIDINQAVEEISPAGVALRNAVMADRAASAAAETGAGIILQSCGTAHILGYEDIGFRYNHSLAAQFAAAGARVLPVILSVESLFIPERVIENKALKHHPNSLIIRGLDEARCTGKTPAAEQTYLDDLETAYSGVTCPFSGDDLPSPPTREEAQAAVEDVIRHAEERLNRETASKPCLAANQTGPGLA